MENDTTEQRKKLLKPGVEDLVSKHEKFQVHLRKSIKHNIFSAKRRKLALDDVEFSSASLNSADGLPADAESLQR